MPPNIVGISSHFHDSACCVIRDGTLVSAAQEERFSRRKHDPALPRRAFRSCLEQAGLTLADIDCIAYYENPTRKLGRQLWAGVSDLTSIPHSVARLDPNRVGREIRRRLGFEGPVEYVAHHEAHAASSFYFSGFPEAAILTVDGVGEWATTTYGRGAGRDLEIFEEVQFPDSLGLLYAAVTSYLGFAVNDGEYKVMGLAPYGEPVYVDKMHALVESLAGGQYRLNMRYFDFLGGERMYSDELLSLFGQPARLKDAPIDDFHQNVASSLQCVLEEVLLEKVRYLHQRAPSENLCMAGGVALNCVANSRILRDGPFARLFIQPAADDAGGALGAAAIAHVRLTGQRLRQHRLEQVYLGPGFSSTEVSELLDTAPVLAQNFHGRVGQLIAAVVERLADGKVIGWFHGRMEFGPRALGARSILADPRDGGMRDRINALVKKREAFRPFAPAVLASKAHEHFDLDHPAPYMLETCQVRSSLCLPAITHVDGSARVQTVDPHVAPRFAALLDEFERRTGCPILLNTSFNMRDEPIVCTPSDALVCFVRAGIDCLVLEDFLIDRSGVPEEWAELIRSVSPTPVALNNRVYSFLSS